MFGKGVYFADMMSKSAGYCYPYLSKGVGILLLCEVAAKPFYERTHAVSSFIVAVFDFVPQRMACFVGI
jgi:hypothetical protein